MGQRQSSNNEKSAHLYHFCYIAIRDEAGNLQAAEHLNWTKGPSRSGKSHPAGMLHRHTSIRTSLLKSRPAVAALRLSPDRSQLRCAHSVLPFSQLSADLTFRSLPKRVAAIVNCANWPAVAAALLLAGCCLLPGRKFLCHQDCKASVVLYDASQ